MSLLTDAAARTIGAEVSALWGSREVGDAVYAWRVKGHDAVVGSR